MSITLAFTVVVVAILVGGVAFSRWDRSRRLCFGDEAGSTTAVWPLSRVESRELVRHPTWLIAGAIVTGITMTLIALDGGSETEAEYLPWFAIVGIPMAGLGLIVSAHRTTTRNRRHGTDELVAATPTSPRTRTVAHLVSCLAPLSAVFVFLLLDLGFIYLLYDATPRPSATLLFPVAAFVLPVLGGAVVGVFLGRWLPFTAAALVGIVAVLVLNNAVDHLHPRYRMLRPAVETDFGGTADIRREGWHLVFVLSVVGLGACLALWRHGPRPALTSATAVVLAVMIGTGWWVTRPPTDAEVAAVVDRLERPTAHLTCSERGDVSYCVVPGVEHWVDDWAPAIEGVVAQVPVDVRPEAIRLVQRREVEAHEFLPEVQAALDPEAAWPADGALHPNYFRNEEHPDLPVAWQAAALAVGLPPATTWQRPVGCMAGGQARVALAHVLAARATPSTSASFDDHAAYVRAERRLDAAVPVDIEWDYDADTPQADSQRTSQAAWLGADGVTRRDHVPYAGASGWGSDVLVAHAIARADRSAVDDAIAANWEELVAPTTPTSRFLHLVGLDAPEGSIGSQSITRLDDPTACV